MENVKKESLEVGQYWQWKMPPYAVFRLNQSIGDGKEFGIGYVKNGQTGQYTAREIERDGKLLCDDQIKHVLILLARDKGFTEPVLVKSFKDKVESITKQSIDKYGFHYDEKMEALFFGGVLIYIQGDWADIVEGKWKVENHDDIPGFFVVNGNAVLYAKNFTEQQSEAIANALNELED